MINGVVLDRKVAGGREYGQIVDVCEYLGSTEFRSPPTALAEIAKKSPLFKRTLDSIEFQNWLAARNAEIEQSGGS